MAINVNDRIDDPSKADVEYYVGLEHLDPESLTIRRWGSPSDVEATKLRFRAGDIIFGRRRVYQRKLGVAHFDGICSAHAMVLRAKPSVALPAFLPFFMQSDLFMERAKEISVGSLSPTINWKTLASEEFVLPPLEKQGQIAIALSQAADLADRYHTAANTLGDLTKRFLLAEYARACRSGAMHKITDVGDLKMGRQKAPKYSSGLCPHPFLRVVNVGELELLLDDIEQMDFTAEELERFRLQPGDILLTEGDLIGAFNVGRPVLFSGEIDDCCFQNTLVRFRPNDRICPEYSLLVFEAARLSHVFAHAAKTTTVTHLGLGRLAEVRIPVPAPEEQKEAAQTFSALLVARAALRQRARGLADVRADLLEALR